jgi:hypothetical protein
LWCKGKLASPFGESRLKQNFASLQRSLGEFNEALSAQLQTV